MINKLISDKKPIILFDDLNQQMGYLMAPAENTSSEMINFMISEGKGLVYVCITQEQAEKLDLPLIGDHEKSTTVSIDYKTSTTGISAFERAETVRAFIKPDLESDNFKRPGHIFPLISKNNQLIESMGIAEAAVIFSKLKSNYPAACVCEILNEQGEVANRWELEELSKIHGLNILKFSEIRNYQYEHTNWLEIIDKSFLDKVNCIVRYKVYSTLHNKEFEIFIRDKDIMTNRVIFYDECEFGDRLGVKNLCKCEKHFSDHYSQLINQQVDAVVFGQKYESSYSHEGNIIKRQITAMIQEINHTNHLVKISNF